MVPLNLFGTIYTETTQKLQAYRTQVQIYDRGEPAVSYK